MILYTRLAGVYDVIYQQIFDYTGEAKMIAKYLSPPAKILDAGCGTGRLAKLLTDLGYTVVGVDISKDMIEIAKRNAQKAQFYKLDIRSLPFRSEFDGIVCLGRTISYMLTEHDLSKALHSFSRSLVSGGFLFLDAFDAEKAQDVEKIEEFNTSRGYIKRSYSIHIKENKVIWESTYWVDGRKYKDVQYLRIFGRGELRKVLEEHGFHVYTISRAKPSIMPAFIVVAKKL